MGFFQTSLIQWCPKMLCPQAGRSKSRSRSSGVAQFQLVQGLDALKFDHSKRLQRDRPSACVFSGPKAHAVRNGSESDLVLHRSLPENGFSGPFSTHSGGAPQGAIRLAACAAPTEGFSGQAPWELAREWEFLAQHGVVTHGSGWTVNQGKRAFGHGPRRAGVGISKIVGFGRRAREPNGTLQAPPSFRQGPCRGQAPLGTSSSRK